MMFGLLSLFRRKKKTRRHIEQKLCCLGCNHLFYWNDGSAGCDLDKQYVCSRNDFFLREGENEY